MVLKFETTNIIVNLPTELLAIIDEASKLAWMSRTEYIRKVMANELKGQTVESLRQRGINRARNDQELDDFLTDQAKGA